MKNIKHIAGRHPADYGDSDRICNGGRRQQRGDQPEPHLELYPDRSRYCNSTVHGRWGMVNSSKGIKGTLLSTLLIIVIVAAAYLIARGHTIEIPDVANGGFFPHPETVITEASILVTYVALGAAVLTAIFTEIYKAFK